MDDGSKKKVTDTYLVSALSVSAAEKRMIEEIAAGIEGESSVTAVKLAKYNEMFRNEDERFYLCKTSTIIFDEESGKEKKANQSILVQADNFKKAIRNLESGMKNSEDYEITSISLSPIIDIL